MQRPEAPSSLSNLKMKLFSLVLCLVTLVTVNASCSGWLTYAGIFPVEKLDRSNRRTAYNHDRAVSKFLMHTVESRWPDNGEYERATRTLDGNRYWPHFVVGRDQQGVVKIGQYLPLDKRGYACRSPGNSYGTIQVEIGAKAAHPFTEEDPELTNAVRQLFYQLTLVCPNMPNSVDPRVNFRSDGAYGEGAPQRLSKTVWASVRGLVGHQHAPSNSHWDPGAINPQKLLCTSLSSCGGVDDSFCENKLDGQYCSSNVNVQCQAGNAVVSQYCGRECVETSAGAQCTEDVTFAEAAADSSGACWLVKTRSSGDQVTGGKCCRYFADENEFRPGTCSSSCTSSSLHFSSGQAAVGCESLPAAVKCCVDSDQTVLPDPEPIVPIDDGQLTLAEACEGVQRERGGQSEGGLCCHERNGVAMKGTCESSCDGGEFFKSSEGAAGCRYLPWDVKCCVGAAKVEAADSSGGSCAGVTTDKAQQRQGGACCKMMNAKFFSGVCDSACYGGELHSAKSGAIGCNGLAEHVKCCIHEEPLPETVAYWDDWLIFRNGQLEEGEYGEDYDGEGSATLLDTPAIIGIAAGAAVCVCLIVVVLACVCLAASRRSTATASMHQHAHHHRSRSGSAARYGQRGLSRRSSTRADNATQFSAAPVHPDGFTAMNVGFYQGQQQMQPMQQQQQQHPSGPRRTASRKLSSRQFGRTASKKGQLVAANFQQGATFL